MLLQPPAAAVPQRSSAWRCPALPSAYPSPPPPWVQGYDATSHFETEIHDVLDLYQRITGRWPALKAVVPLSSWWGCGSDERVPRVACAHPPPAGKPLDLEKEDLGKRQEAQ